jgi:hypothetical protein
MVQPLENLPRLYLTISYREAYTIHRPFDFELTHVAEGSPLRLDWLLVKQRVQCVIQVGHFRATQLQSGTQEIIGQDNYSALNKGDIIEQGSNNGLLTLF